MDADFSGYVTRVGLKCTDGRTIMPDAFKHQHKQKVPLVWQHQHNDPMNVLGHALLENRADGVYGYGYFNTTEAGQMAKQLVKHGDIDNLSIYANNLSQSNKNVNHGDIREVSLVLSGANPGAYIDNVNLHHSSSTEDFVDEEAVIYTGLPIELSDQKDLELIIEHKDQEDPKTQQGENMAEEKTVKDVFDTLTEEQKNVVYYMIGEALASAEDEMEQSDSSEYLTHQGDFYIMPRNVFEQNGTVEERPTLSHSQLKEIMSDASRLGSLKESFLAHAGDYGIDDIEFLFPDAKSITNSPEMLSRRMEWVTDVLGKTKHSPFSRIKSVVADITADEARAKGYVKGSMKKDEVIKLLKRVTTPTTVYKKQKLDRDDIVDITDLDVIAWLKAEMRIMLDEEIARSILVGDGREPDDPDKIDEDHLRPIAYDVDMYAHSITLDSSPTPAEMIEAIVRARRYYKGTGTPTLYTTDAKLTDMILDKDSLGRRYYNTEAELAAALRVDRIVTVEAMEDAADIAGIIVNLVDYTVGADQGGAISMFDDFDIDYNQQKYLIETRISGALTKPKSAIVIRNSPGTSVVPTQPTYVPATHTITIPSKTGVVYKVDGVAVDAGALVITETTEVEAVPATGYSFPHLTDADWVFVY